MLSLPVQTRASLIIDDDSKTAYDLWHFIIQTYTARNTQAIQNIKAKLNILIFEEGSDWDNHLHEFESLLTQLAVQNVDTYEQDKILIFIRSLRESLSIISTVATAQPDIHLVH